ncbi:MAG: 3-hydroxyacyl-CoA dehydrogenase PaaC [uncultured Frankineae bacterium]|uniref:3-hydroxyacyl-CoA dehydrogenase PaaC n=1 Tax=uncultured Frankineae bacterium TaxID=437475 RepID=A0A6J4LB75_9ACTN|nr:MAG: 3-hydroxyacyl-CoA dehydrogenase PaaC [uncultured Frankineae bacterium]
MARSFDTVGVVGLGTMGAGIAEVLARSGLQVVGVEADPAGVQRAQEHLAASTGRAVAKGKLTAREADEVLGRITTGTELSALRDCDLVLEAVPERMEHKAALFAELDALLPPSAVLATNTSALSVTELATGTSRPSQVVGLHWFNPAPVMELVEVVRTVVTDPSVLEDVQALVSRVGKTSATAGDRAGFIANALLFGYLNNALRMYENRYASREDIDAAMRLGTGHPMGPLALLDLIGLDSAYEILETMYGQSRDHRHAPAPLLKQYVTAGLLGRKTGRGIYTYAAPDSPEVVADDTPPATSAAPARTVRRIGVVGTGTMASGIVEVCARAGYDVVFRARGEDRLAQVQARIEGSLDKALQRGRLTEQDRAATLARLRGTTELDDLADCDLVVEAVVEDLAVKKALFAALDEVVRPGAVLATTTSSLPVIECAQATSRPQDVVGMHWFNPATVMRLVEVVPTVTTADDVVATVLEVCRTTGKHPVLCGDRAGFIVNALLFPYLNDAVKMLEAHYATIDDIDFAMTKGCGHPMGPFALMDVVGLDVTLAIQRTLFDEFREPGDAPAPMLEHLVKAGYLGRKTGRGFRDYSKR